MMLAPPGTALRTALAVRVACDAGDAVGFGVSVPASSRVKVIAVAELEAVGPVERDTDRRSARARLGDRRACRLRRRQTLGEVELHAADPTLIAVGVQPKSAGGTHRCQQPVSVLPRPEHVIADADAPAELADPQHAALVIRSHGNTLQKFDNSC